MSGKVFVDTNILIYAFDADAGRKHEAAKALLKTLWEQESGALSMQVLQEFYNNVTRKITTPLPRELARRIVLLYSEWCVETTPLEISQAFQIEDRHQVSFWDALILSAAHKSGAKVLFTEDLNHGQNIDGILVNNPFRA